MKRIGLIILILLVLMLMRATLAMADELEGKDWMQFDKTARALYVMGFYHGVQETVRAVKLDFRMTELITYEELSEQVYNKLLRERELRAGPTGAIILTILGNYLVITDRTGKPIQSK